MELSVNNLEKIIDEEHKTMDHIFHLKKKVDGFLNFNKKKDILEIDRLEKKLMEKYNITILDLMFVFSLYKVEGRKEKC